MEPQTAEAGNSATAGLALADKQINVLRDKILPQIPHLLSVPTKNQQYMPTYPYENQETPFEEWEISQMQYMTLISNADRGVGYAQGNWEDTINASSSAAKAPSSISTPDPLSHSRKPAAVKMSIADYKNRKTTGVKPSPRADEPTTERRLRADSADRKPEHSRNTSATSISAPMARVPSFEGENQRQNGLGADLRKDRNKQNDTTKADIAVPQRSKAEESKVQEKPRQSNGTLARDLPHARDTNHNVRPTNPDPRHTLKEPPKGTLPPRPRSPQGSHPDSKPQKRPLESGHTQPEKRAKVDHADSRTPPVIQKPSNRKLEANDARPSPSKTPRPAQSTSSYTSPQPSKSARSRTRLLDTKAHSSMTSVSEKPSLPPLLSPLPADLEPPPWFDPPQKAEKTNTQTKNSSQANEALDPDTIVVKQSYSKKPIPTSSPLAPSPDNSPPFVLPPLLSPDLPPIVEAELHRLQQKAATVSTLHTTVEARHEKARQPGAPGVAQKRPKIGHPPKKNKEESSGGARKVKIVEKAPNKPSLIVKLPIKKADRGRVKDLLRLRPNQSQRFKALEAVRRGIEPPPRFLSTEDESESEEDASIEVLPLVSRATKGPAPTTSKKRPAENDRKNPPLKREKALENIDVAKAPTPLAVPFKSPAINPNSVRDVAPLATPKKGDSMKETMKSVAMRRVDSGDTNARTPQPTSTSTPASAERPRTTPKKPIDQQEMARCTTDEAKFYPLGTDLKRKSQAAVLKKGASDEEKKVGVMRGIEGLMAYMIAFYSRDRIEVLAGRPQKAEFWEQFFTVWSFVDGNARTFPELRTLLEQLGAVSRELLMKVYQNLPAESRNWDSVLTCLRHRDSLWVQCKRNEKLVLDMGIQGTLGPWSSLNDAVGFGVATLSYYAVAQNLEWEGDSHFSTISAKQFMKR